MKTRADDPVAFRDEDIAPLRFCERAVGLGIHEPTFPFDYRARVFPQYTSSDYVYVDPKKAKWAKWTDGGPVRVYPALKGVGRLDCKRAPCRR